MLRRNGFGLNTNPLMKKKKNKVVEPTEKSEKPIERKNEADDIIFDIFKELKKSFGIENICEEEIPLVIFVFNDGRIFVDKLIKEKEVLISEKMKRIFTGKEITKLQAQEIRSIIIRETDPESGLFELKDFERELIKLEDLE